MAVSSGSSSGSSSSGSSTSSSTITSESTKNIIIIIGINMMVGNKGGWFTSYIVARERINISKNQFGNIIIAIDEMVYFVINTIISALEQGQTILSGNKINHCFYPHSYF